LVFKFLTRNRQTHSPRTRSSCRPAVHETVRATIRVVDFVINGMRIARIHRPDRNFTRLRCHVHIESTVYGHPTRYYTHPVRRCAIWIHSHDQVIFEIIEISCFLAVELCTQGLSICLPYDNSPVDQSRLLKRVSNDTKNSMSRQSWVGSKSHIYVRTYLRFQKLLFRTVCAVVRCYIFYTRGLLRRSVSNDSDIIVFTPV